MGLLNKIGKSITDMVWPEYRPEVRKSLGTIGKVVLYTTAVGVGLTSLNCKCKDDEDQYVAPKLEAQIDSPRPLPPDPTIPREAEVYIDARNSKGSGIHLYVINGGRTDFPELEATIPFSTPGIYQLVVGIQNHSESDENSIDVHIGCGDDDQVLGAYLKEWAEKAVGEGGLGYATFDRGAGDAGHDDNLPDHTTPDPFDRYTFHAYAQAFNPSGQNIYFAHAWEDAALAQIIHDTITVMDAMRENNRTTLEGSAGPMVFVTGQYETPQEAYTRLQELENLLQNPEPYTPTQIEQMKELLIPITPVQQAAPIILKGT